MKGYEIFIAYRRSASKDIAERIYEELIHRGYETFLDTQELGGGNYRDKNLPEIANNSTNYLVIVTNKTFERCISDEQDLFAKGIEFALSNGKNIIPIFASVDTKFPDYLPDNIREIKNQNGLFYEENDFNRCIDKLIKKFLVDRKKSVVSDASRDFYIEDGTLIEYLGNASKVYIPDSVNKIAERAFKDKTKVEEVTFPEGLSEIENGAFERCNSILNVNIPNSVCKIGDDAFSRCYKLAYVKLGSGLRELGERTFSYCCKLKWIQLPENLEIVHGSVFNGCSMLNAIFVDENSTNLVSQNGILYDYEMKALIRCPENYEEDYIDIEQSVISIKPYAFYRCLNIQQINLPKKVEEICEFSFEGCCNVAHLVLSGSIKKFDITAIEGWNAEQVKFSRDFSPLEKRKIEEKLKNRIITPTKERAYEFVIVKTTFESIEEAKNMANILLRFKYIASGQIHKLESVYLWEHELNDELEYELNCITISSKCDKVMEVINKNHSYQTCQVLVTPVYEVSDEIADWLYDCLEVKRC